MPFLSPLQNPQVLYSTAVAALLFATLMAALAGFVYFLKSRLQRKLSQLEGRMLAAEARASEHQRGLQGSQHGDLKTRSAQAQKPAASKNKQGAKQGNEGAGGASSPQELLQLRRDLAHTRYETKKLREELKARDAQVKEAKQNEETRLFALREENKRLVEQLRNTEKSTRDSLHSPAKIAELEAQFKERLKALEVTLEAARETARSQGVEKARAAELENRRLRDALKQTELRLEKMESKTIDPRVFVRWKERALEGRKMYQLMRQMRELSHEKLTSYQDAVTDLSRFVLEQKHQALPEVKAGEEIPDVYLAHAWAAVVHPPPPDL